MNPDNKSNRAHNKSVRPALFVSKYPVPMLSWREPRPGQPHGNIIVFRSPPGDIRKNVLQHLYTFRMDGVLIKYDGKYYVCKKGKDNASYLRSPASRQHTFAYLLELQFLP